MKPKIQKGLALSIIPQIILVKWFGSYPDLVEKYYSEGIYPILSKFLRLLFGWIPFSVGDIFYTILGIAIIRYVYLNGKSFRKQPLKLVQHLGITVSIAYFIFHLFWGMNYYRIPINEKFGIVTTTYSVEELESFARKLIQQANGIQYSLARDVTKAVEIPVSRKDIFRATINGYEDFAKNYPNFKYTSPSLKTSLYSLPLTYMGYGGYLNPFTGEAQVNSKIPIIRFPTVSAHEIGHQVGYSSESATNFIGFLVTSRTMDMHFKYACYSHALAYTLSDLRRLDQEKFDLLWEDVNEGVKKNYEEISKFWSAYENPTEPVFKWVFNAFLKANSQPEGIQSYNAVVGLLINYDKEYGF
ncbi:DUF3810 domain-containing protein [Croceitalea sp. MTPC9]|uniref:DUF3810 domain-containing protein n=1 Tax=unclassified Croceitalea TaxID=2632280 RepID=UPI002B3DA15B|nr:DUF3810 domain-containing protein [Croceitalea sp. MTPC6]GMN15245.1 DUF3810 domain-containing protein [Croceitalea sp. MTPC9]